MGPPTPQGVGGRWSGYLGGWRWSGDLLDDVGMTGTTQERCWDDTGTTGTIGTTWGRDHGDNGDHGDHRSWGPHGDLLGAMGMMWG